MIRRSYFTLLIQKSIVVELNVFEDDIVLKSGFHACLFYDRFSYVLQTTDSVKHENGIYQRE